MRTKPLRYQSTGEEIPDRSTVSPERAEELRLQRENSPEAERERLAQRQDERLLEADSPSANHERGVREATYQFQDLLKDPVLSLEFLAERERLKEELFKKGQVVSDWSSTYRDIGNAIRRKVGYKTTEEVQRAEALEEAGKSRGQKT
jgi:hypothetical protein